MKIDKSKLGCQLNNIKLASEYKILRPLIDIHDSFTCQFISPQDFELAKFENTGTCWDSVYKMYDYIRSNYGIAKQRLFIKNSKNLYTTGSHAFLLFQWDNLWFYPEFTCNKKYNGFYIYEKLSDFTNAKENKGNNGLLSLDPNLLYKGMNFNQFLNCKYDSFIGEFNEATN